MQKSQKKTLPITFYSKEKTICPVCKREFRREELLSGGGRLIAGRLTDELRRTFEPSSRYGKIYPMIYSIAACPVCHMAMLWSDLDSFEDEATIQKLIDTERERRQAVDAVFPHFDFKRDRTLFDGAAAYYMALLCYEQFPPSFSPTIKKAQISLRLAWLCSDIEKECPDHNFGYMSQVFYRKALFFYEDAYILEMSHEESITGISNFGPDIDKNYGYDGVVYLTALLEYKYGQRVDVKSRLKKLDSHKRAIARIFGLGKSSKSKPGPLLEHSRTLYDNIGKEIKEANTIDIGLSFEDDED